MADASRAHYRALVHEHPEFPAYFRAATPIDVIERLQIGSRPSRRRDGGIGNLRAIPWVFAWSQNRSGLTGWFGIGHALDLGVRNYGLDAMREMARDWPFFAAMIDDVEMISMLIPASASASNMSAATPGWLFIPAPISETLAIWSS